MGSARFLAPNLITAASMITPSSTAAGVLSNAQKEGAGAGTMATAGDYSGTTDRDYLVQIDLAGALGAATFKWSNDDGMTFTASGVATSSSAIALENGITVIFGAGPFVLGDIWRFKAYRPYGASKLIDLDRNSEWRSASDVSAAINVVIDFGSAKTPDALVIDKHNFTSAATIKIQADDDPAFGTLGVDETVTWASGQIVHTLTTTPRAFRYWRLRVTNTANPDGYLSIAELVLTATTGLTRNFAPGLVRTRERVADRMRTPAGTFYGGLNAVVEVFEIEWRLLESADRTTLLDVYAALMDESEREIRPIYFQPDRAVATVTRSGVACGDVYLCEWDGDMTLRHREGTPDDWDAPIRLVEIPRTRA